MSRFEDIFSEVEKSLKKDPHASIHKAGDLSIKSRIPFGILTGVPELDFNIGRPGWPAGRCIELYGFEHCGKTTLALHAIAQAQRMGGGAVFIDTEKTWDEERASQVGVDLEKNFRIGEADSVEGAFRTILSIVEARLKYNDGSPLVVVVDSVTGSATEAMKAQTIGEEARMGGDARAIRGGMRRIVPALADSKITLIMINHAIANMATNKYAPQSTAAGGHAIKLFSTIRCNLAPSGWINDDDTKERLGQKIKIKIEKLKGASLAYPEVQEVHLLKSVGFSTMGNLLDAGIKAGWIEHKDGSKTYALGEDSFPKVDWPAIVDQHGGTNAMYREFIDWCIACGKISPWSE